MPYKKMYMTLFHAATDAIAGLTQAQQKAEALYINQEPSLSILPTAEHEEVGHAPQDRDD